MDLLLTEELLTYFQFTLRSLDLFQLQTQRLSAKPSVWNINSCLAFPLIYTTFYKCDITAPKLLSGIPLVFAHTCHVSHQTAFPVYKQPRKCHVFPQLCTMCAVHIHSKNNHANNPSKIVLGFKVINPLLASPLQLEMNGSCILHNYIFSRYFCQINKYFII